MVWIFAFARSGSTIIQKLLSGFSGYSPLFEPFGFKPEKLKNESDISLVIDWFKGTPEIRELKKYKKGSFFIGHIPENGFDSSLIKPYREKLKNYLRDIYDNYGERTIVKCVRQQGNIKFLNTILEEIGIKAGYIFLKRNPFEIAYSYCKNGGFHKKSDWRVNQLFEYRKNMYKGENKELDAMFSGAKTTLDKLISAIIADYNAFDETNMWLEERSVSSMILKYEDFIKRPVEECYNVLNSLDIPVDNKKI